MKVQMEVDTSDPASIAEGIAVLQTLAGGSGASAGAPPAGAPPAGTPPAGAPPAGAPPAGAPPATAMSQADFGAAVQAYAKALGPKAAKAKLAEFGFGKTADVPAERYAEIAQHLAV